MTWSKAVSTPYIRLFLLILIALVFVYYLIPRPSSFSVTARSEYLKVAVSDLNQPDWYLPAVVACIRPEDGSRLNRVGNTTCGPRFEEHSLEAVDLRFRSGYGLTFRGFEPGIVELAVDKDEDAAEVRLDGFDATGAEQSIALTTGSALRIPFNTGDRPDIATRGFVDLGERPSASAGLFLRQARYEVRQKMFDKTHVVASGQFLLGDKVNFLKQGCVLWLCAVDTGAIEEVAATVVVSSDTRFSAFDVILTTPNEYSAIGITRIGSDLTELPITWTSRLASDPRPAALATLIGLLGALVGLTNTYLAGRDQKPSAPPADTNKS